MTIMLKPPCVCVCVATRRFAEDKRVLMYVLVLGSPGLIIVDHIHFQYNGMLLGELPLPSLSFLSCP